LICILTLVFEGYWATTGALMWGVLVGLMHASIGLSVQHDASHGAFSSSPTVNALFSYGADWIGSCRWIWLQQHVLWHHPYTNIHGLDGDAQSAEPAIVFHDYSASGTKSAPPSHPFLKFQHYITNLVLMFYGPSIVYNFSYLTNLRHSENVPLSVSSGPYMSAQKPTVWALRLWYILRIVIAPWWLAGRQLLVSAVLCNVVCGACLTFVFAVSHNFEGSDRDPTPESAEKKELCWYKLQAETSSTYGGFTAGFFTGGLNFQVEHHLFPRCSSWNYPMLQPVIKDCCERHGVQYNYFPTLASNLVSMLKYMRKVGIIAVIKMARED
jgi:fatty acid desaturase